MTYLRWRVQLPVHGGPRSVVQKTRLPTQTPPLQVNILVWVLLLCGDDVHNQCGSNIMSTVKLANIQGQMLFLTEDRGCGCKEGKQSAVNGVRGTRGPHYGWSEIR